VRETIQAQDALDDLARVSGEQVPRQGEILLDSIPPTTRPMAQQLLSFFNGAYNQNMYHIPCAAPPTAPLPCAHSTNENRGSFDQESRLAPGLLDIAATKVAIP